jgi:hypothetical protein
MAETATGSRIGFATLTAGVPDIASPLLAARR